MMDRLKSIIINEINEIHLTSQLFKQLFFI